MSMELTCALVVREKIAWCECENWWLKQTQLHVHQDHNAQDRKWFASVIEHTTGS